MAAKVEAYCMKERERREIKDPEFKAKDNGAVSVSGNCKSCGTKVYTICKRDAAGVPANVRAAAEKAAEKKAAKKTGGRASNKSGRGKKK